MHHHGGLCLDEPGETESVDEEGKTEIYLVHMDGRRTDGTSILVESRPILCTTCDHLVISNRVCSEWGATSPVHHRMAVCELQIPLRPVSEHLVSRRMNLYYRVVFGRYIT